MQSQHQNRGRYNDTLLEVLSSEGRREGVCEALVGSMIQTADELKDEYIQEVECHLSDSEAEVFREVNELAFKEGAWYRPLHNIVVPLCMLHIIEGEGLARDLVFPAMNHDAGNSLMKIAPTTQGADWQNKDKRVAHMEIGAKLCREQLERIWEKQLSDPVLEHLDITHNRIEQLADIVAHHDDPYIGKELSDPEHLAHRDADRCFVPSALSFWKDYIAYLNDSGCKANASELGVSITPTSLIQCRIASFYSTEQSLPESITRMGVAYAPHLVGLTEAGIPEPQSTSTGEQIAEKFIINRLAEIEEFAHLKSIDEFDDFFRKSLSNEMRWLLASLNHG